MMKNSFLRSRSFAHVLFFFGTISHLLNVYAQQPEPCPNDPSISGFTSLKDLNVFMVNVWTFINQGGQLSSPFFFTLCPDTIYSDDYIFPLLNDTWIICGRDGSASNNCTLNNETHIVILPHEYNETVTEPLEQVNFFGLTLTQSTDISVAAYGSETAWAYFFDCHWKNNAADFGLHIESIDTSVSDSMFVQLESCTFKNDTYAHSAVFNHLGNILITDTVFEDITNEWGTLVAFYHYQTSCFDSLFKSTNNYFTIGAVGGHLSLNDNIFMENDNELATIYVSDIGGVRSVGTTFLSNSQSLGPILLSDDSFLLLNEDNIGMENSGVTDCQGFFTMKTNTTCNELDCPGTCCAFGNFTCDLTNDTFTPFPSISLSPTSTPTNFPRSEVASPSGDTTSTTSTTSITDNESSTTSGVFGRQSVFPCLIVFFAIITLF